MTTFPRWTWADTNAMRVEVEDGLFIDYVHRGGLWRQKTSPMTPAESVTPERHCLGDWRDGPTAWPAVDDEMAAWLDKTMAEVRS